MDLVDRYLKAVESALPVAQREDIVRELSEDIRSEMEEKESALGRPLTDEEQKGLLKQRGNPLLLAARYRQDHRSLALGPELIGPVLFPFYARVLSFNLGLTFAIIAAIFIGLGVSGQKIGFNDIVSTCLLQLFIQLWIVTLIFWQVQKHFTKHPDRWDLSGFRGGLRLGLKAQKNVDVHIRLAAPQVSRFESVSIIVASAVALAWITEVQRYPFLILGPAAAFLKLAPVWYQAYFAIVLLTALEIVRAVINLVRPDWTLFRAVYGLVLHSGGLVLVYFLLRAGNWVTGLDALVNRSSDYAQTVVIVNQVFYYLLIGVAIFSAVMLVVRAAGLIRRLRRPGESTPISAAAKQGN